MTDINVVDFPSDSIFNLDKITGARITYSIYDSNVPLYADFILFRRNGDFVPLLCFEEYLASGEKPVSELNQEDRIIEASEWNSGIYEKLHKIDEALRTIFEVAGREVISVQFFYRNQWPNAKL